MILKLSVNNQSVESSGITKDYKDALCEYVWNSFEANATAVAIDCIPNELTGSAEIVITDNGDGIAYDSLERTFGAFLDSQKNSRSLQIKTKANKGKGRFSCFSFASLAEWSTVTATPDGNIAYSRPLWIHFSDGYAARVFKRFFIPCFRANRQYRKLFLLCQ